MARKLSSGLYKKAFNEKDKGGSSRKSFMDWKVFENPPKMFDPKDGEAIRFDIIPYPVKSKNHPQVHSGQLGIDDLDFMLDVCVHRRAGPNQDIDILCPKKNYGRPCPICEESAKYYEKGDKAGGKSLKATRRTLINIRLVEKGVPQDSIQVFDVSHFLFMKELLEEAHACNNGEDIIPFADPDGGYTVRFRANKAPLGENSMLEFKSFAFEKREKPLADSIMEQACSFDKALILMSYDDIQKIMYGQDDEVQDTKESGKEEKQPVEKKEQERKEPVQEKKDDKGCPKGFKWGEADKHLECKKCNPDLWDRCVEG